jgi:hypothetical protein
MRKAISLVAILLVLVIPTVARAQALDCGCMATVEEILREILAEDTITADSVSTPGPAIFNSQAQFLNSLMQIMEGGVYSADAMLALYPGWVDPGPNAAEAAQNITIQTMQTYAGAIAVAQSQASDLQLQDAKLQTLEGCAHAPTVLAAIQCGNDIKLAGIQEEQLHRQLDITRLIVEAVHSGWELNMYAQAGANNQVSQLTAAEQ